MSVLISDISHCADDFGRLLFSSASEWSIHAEVAGVTTEGLALTQHTEYKIVITAVPRNSLEHDSRIFQFAGRFKEFNRLWMQLSKVHKQLYLRGTFPQFAPTKFFGNTEPAVIKERVEAITCFLNFVLASEVLRKAISLHRFFDGIVEIERQSDESASNVSFNLRSRDSVSSEEIFVEHPLPSNTVDDMASREVVEASNEQLTISNKSTVEELTLTRRYKHVMTSSPSGSNVFQNSSSSCLFDFPSADFYSKDAYDDASSPSASQLSVRGNRSSDLLLESGNSRSFLRNAFPKVAHSNNFRLGGRLETPEVSTAFSYDQRSLSSGSFFVTTAFPGFQTQASNSATNVATNAFSIIPPLTSLSVASSTTSNDYLAVAAQFISAAQKAETESAFELAFQCYKSAVKALLQGVQFERDLPIRNRVRKKTAKYLLKAEKLYRSYLSFDGSTFEAGSWLSSTVQDPNLLAFQGSSAVLKTLRIITALPSFQARKRVYLVENRSLNDGTKFVLKMLEKSCLEKHPMKIPNSNIIPLDIPNMVQLHKFFDTDSYVILLLEYVKCGRLWDFLDDYFAEQRRKIYAFHFGKSCHHDRSCGLEDFFANQPSTSVMLGSFNRSETIARNSASAVLVNSACSFRANMYEGKRVRFSIGDTDEPTDLTDSEHVSQVEKKISLTSIENNEHLDGSLVTAENQTYCIRTYDSRLLTEGNTLQRKSTSFEQTAFAEVEEEAPAPIILRSSQPESTSASQNRSGIGELSLSEALEKAKLTLFEQGRWSRRCQLPESLIAFWVGQLTNAVYFLHSQGIVIRDLRPDNLLLDESANLKLTFCSQWQEVENHVDETASIDCYAAPETASVLGVVSDAADRWSIGAILMELFCGQRLSEIFLHGFEGLGELPIPDCIALSFAARDLLSKLLVKEPLQRISDDELRAHPFFDGLG